uniref:Uncharacterized protein n=1 Tax=Tsukubamonas globosa TaxID=875863 RepID=W8VY39_9EUKA|nr:hypothetical protein [Tsukubamonas globosa]BAO51992.1 hypothetical protein [Tsukubamonas globosa]
MLEQQYLRATSIMYMNNMESPGQLEYIYPAKINYNHQDMDCKRGLTQELRSKESWYRTLSILVPGSFKEMGETLRTMEQQRAVLENCIAHPGPCFDADDNLAKTQLNARIKLYTQTPLSPKSAPF